MMSGPTLGVGEDRAWSARPLRAFLVRALVALVPILVAFVTTHFAAPGLWRPAGWVGVAIFLVQGAVVGSAAALLADRASRRLLPLAALLNVTLVFPDRAPSRFGVALRSGTIRQLRASLQQGRVEWPRDHQLAAEQLVAMMGELGRHERLTRGHAERVRAYSELIGEEMGLGSGDRELLHWAAIVHDIGKLTVPPEILNKDGQPTDEEWEILKRHPAAGGELLAPLASWLGDWRLAASQHHERWDGAGYPHGLRGTEITLAGRIVAVADAYDVVTSVRSYKKPLSLEAAREELVRCAGTHFDPEVVRALLTASLARERVSLGFIGWLSELGGLSAIPRGFAQAAATVATAAAVISGAVLADTRPAETTAQEGAAPVTADEPEQPERLPHTDVDGDEHEPSTSIVTDGGEGPTGQTDDRSPTTPGLPTFIPSSDTTAGTTTTTTTTTTPTTTTTSPPPAVVDWNPGGGGFTVSQAVLPLDETLQTGALSNYDTDRDSEPGLLLQKTGSGLAETDPVKTQRWALDPSENRLQGTPVLRIWVAIKDFDTSKTGQVQVGLFDCDASYGDCTQLTAASGSFSQASYGADFGQVTITMPDIDHMFVAGRTVVLEVVTADASDDDLWYAYANTSYPTNLTIN
jgi:hypothetical protein